MGKEKETKLAEKRKAKNWTQQQLAEESGVAVRSIRAYEQGSKEINKAQAISVYNLAKALECEVKDLLELD